MGRGRFFAVISARCLAGSLLWLVTSGCTTAPAARVIASDVPAATTPRVVEEYRLSPSNTKVVVRVVALTSHMLEFERLQGELVLAVDRLERSRASLQIDVTTATAWLAVVAKVAKSERFLAATRYPHARFESHSLTRRGDQLYARGWLQLRAVRKMIEVPLTVDVSPCRVVVRSSFRVDRRLFGVQHDGISDALVANDIGVEVHIALPRKRPHCKNT